MKSCPTHNHVHRVHPAFHVDAPNTIPLSRFQVAAQHQVPHLPAQDGPREHAAVRRLRPRPPHVLPQAEAEGGAEGRLVLQRLQAQGEDEVAQEEGEEGLLGRGRRGRRPGTIEAASVQFVFRVAGRRFWSATIDLIELSH